MKTEGKHGHESQKSEAFIVDQPYMDVIRIDGFAKYAERLPELKWAFDLSKNKVPKSGNECCLCCMDERTPFGVHLAGSGILLPRTNFDESFKESGADSISSHDGCGAAKIFIENEAKRLGLQISSDEDGWKVAKIIALNSPWSNMIGKFQRDGMSYSDMIDKFQRDGMSYSDAIGRVWAEAMAKEAGVSHVHLKVEKDFHYARVCYYDGTGRFNYKGVEGLPAGFVVGKINMSKESSLAEVGVAIKIALGDHGFGHLFTKENPFVLAVIGQTEEEMNLSKDELREKYKDLENVVIDGFVAPQE